MRLFDSERERRPTWTGNVLPVLAAPLCPNGQCRAPLATLPAATQPALFFHGGYGAAQRTVHEVCVACGWVRVASVESVNPRTL